MWYTSGKKVDPVGFLMTSATASLRPYRMDWRLLDWMWFANGGNLDPGAQPADRLRRKSRSWAFERIVGP